MDRTILIQEVLKNKQNHQNNLKRKNMKRNIKSLTGFTMGATDGEIGKVKEFYFDDETWTIRYLIVETGSWLNHRKVLIAPEALLNLIGSMKFFRLILQKNK